MRCIIRRFLCAVAMTASCYSMAAEGPKIVLIAAGIEKQIYLPARLAMRLGYFKEQGLDVELLSEPAGVNAQDMLLTGAAQGVVGAYDHTIVLQSKGKSVQSVVQFTASPGEVELIAYRLTGQVKSPTDLKNRKLGVTGLGSSTAFLTQYLATMSGLKPTDYELVPVGSGKQFLQAMRLQKIDAGMTTEPTATILLSQGEAQILTDLRTPESTQKVLGGSYPFACLYLQTAWIAAHSNEVQRLSNALVKALQFIQSHRADEIADQLPPDDWAGNKPLYVKSLASSISMFTADGVMPEQGPATVLKVLAAINRSVNGRSIDLSKTFTTEFVKASKLAH